MNTTPEEQQRVMKAQEIIIQPSAESLAGLDLGLAKIDTLRKENMEFFLFFKVHGRLVAQE